MWRFGIAAFLLPVLFVLVVDMLFGGRGSARLRSYLPSYWYAALTNGPEADGGHARSRSPGLAALSPGMARHRSYLLLSGDLSSARKSDDAPPSSILTALPPAGDVPFEEPWPAYSRFRRITTVPVPAVRPPEAPVSRDIAKGERQEAHDASERMRINQEGKPSSVGKVTARQIAGSEQACRSWVRSWSGGWTHRRAAKRLYANSSEMRGCPSRIDDRLLAILNQEASSRAQLRRKELQGITASLPKAEQSEERGIFGSLLGGFQRLLGRDFDSIRRPDEPSPIVAPTPLTGSMISVVRLSSIAAMSSPANFRTRQPVHRSKVLALTESISAGRIPLSTRVIDRPSKFILANP